MRVAVVIVPVRVAVRSGVTVAVGVFVGVAGMRVTVAVFVGVAAFGQADALGLPPMVLRKHHAVSSKPPGTCPPPCTT